ncbi:MAG: GNAT family N-acetyltransferase [Steroidobacteraceae bacterium]
MATVPEGLINREATVGDLTAVARIYAPYVLDSTSSFELTAPDVGEMQRRFAALRAAGLPYLVAVIDEQVVGYGYAGAYRSRPAYGDTVENSVYLDRAWCGRGIGGALLPSLIERCEAGPWRQRIAVIADTGNIASIALHRRCRFERVGTLKSVGYKLGRWVDSVLMQRALGPGDSNAPR